MKSLKPILVSSLFLWITLFAIAMGMLESAVVVYLRELYYADGFTFPLHPTSNTVAITELFRELATLIMLIAIGFIAGKNRPERFAWFIYSFAVWDIFYYVFLKVLIAWPATFSDWDVLFLLPTLWVGPVWAPILLSCLMIVLALQILIKSSLNKNYKTQAKTWYLLISGSLIVISSFCTDFIQYVLQQNDNLSIGELFFSEKIFEYSSSYIPQHFSILHFSIGLVVIIGGIVNNYVSK